MMNVRLIIVLLLMFVGHHHLVPGQTKTLTRTSVAKDLPEGPGTGIMPEEGQTVKTYKATGPAAVPGCSIVPVPERTARTSVSTAPSRTTIRMDFENVPDFSLTFDPWTVRDVDQKTTYGITNYTFPHQMEKMAYLCFNPAAVNPTMAGDQAIQPHGGQRFGACFSSNPPSNDDWIISPQVQLGIGGSFSFWIKSYNDTYGLDDYQVAVSTTDMEPASFTIISGAVPLTTTTEWTKKVFNLAPYNNQSVYVAIRCVSNDRFLMMIDDLEIIPEASSGLQADFTADKTSVNEGESVSFSDLTTGLPTSWSWSFPGGTPATSALQNPSGIVYSTTGKYAVTLKVSNGVMSDSVTKERFITVGSLPSSAFQDFESFGDFVTAMDPWTTADVNGGATYGLYGVNFTHSMEPMAWICFNPSKTSPPLTNMQAHSGTKLGCSFSTMPPKNPNNKWLISPQLHLKLSPRIDFWVQTYNPEYGYEKFRVAVSTQGTSPSDFTPLTAAADSAPATWTQKSYSLAQYANTDVYVGIQCITDNGFILMVDDINISSLVGSEELVETGTLSLMPNPASGRLHVSAPGFHLGRTTLELISGMGIVVRSWPVTLLSNGDVILDVSDVPAGMYILRIHNETGEFSGKLSIIH